jgi:hypothetical protein
MLIPLYSSQRHSRADSLLDSPLHQAVCDNERGDGVENLVPRAAHDVPEALADEGGHGSLSVRAESIGHDALAGSAATLVGVTPAANVPSVFVPCQPESIL